MRHLTTKVILLFVVAFKIYANPFANVQGWSMVPATEIKQSEKSQYLLFSPSKLKGVGNSMKSIGDYGVSRLTERDHKIITEAQKNSSNYSEKFSSWAGLERKTLLFFKNLGKLPTRKIRFNLGKGEAEARLYDITSWDDYQFIVRRVPSVNDISFKSKPAYSASLMSKSSGYYIGGDFNVKFPPIVYILAVNPAAVFITSPEDFYTPNPGTLFGIKHTINELKKIYMSSSSPYLSTNQMIASMDTSKNDSYNELFVLGELMARDFGKLKPQTKVSRLKGFVIEEAHLERLLTILQKDFYIDESGEHYMVDKNMKESARRIFSKMLKTKLPIIIVHTDTKTLVKLTDIAKDLFAKLTPGNSDLYTKALGDDFDINFMNQLRSELLEVQKGQKSPKEIFAIYRRYLDFLTKKYSKRLRESKLPQGELKLLEDRIRLSKDLLEKLKRSMGKGVAIKNSQLKKMSYKSKW